MAEFDWISRYFLPLAAPEGLGLQDDAACFAPRHGSQIILTQDAITSGTHFLPDDPPHLIAQKLLRVNLSDLAAKGATPKGYLLSLTLPADTTEEWVADFAEGLKRDQSHFGIPLWGGDTTAHSYEAISLSLTAIGDLPSGSMLRRNGAMPSDKLYLSGELGLAAQGLAKRKLYQSGTEAAQDADCERYFLPQPRLALGIALREQQLASSCMDISDGLAQDAEHLAKASGRALRIETAALPYSGNLTLALTGGDDYELLFTSNPKNEDALQWLAAQHHTPIHCIGQVLEGSAKVDITDKNGHPIPIIRGGWQHF